MTPPRLSRSMLALLLPGRMRPFVLDDLGEEFHARARKEGRAAARRWYRRQVLAGAGPALRMRWRSMAGVLGADSGRAVRRLGRSPGFAVVTIVTVGLGLGATTAIFALVNGILLRPLPYPEPERLVIVKHAMPAFDVVDALQSTATYFHYRDHAASFVDMGIFQSASVNLTGDGEARQIGLIMATPSFFSTLGVTPVLGRVFTEADVAPGGDPVVILSHRLWRERYGSDPAVIGREVVINNRAREVVGVLPADFEFPGVDGLMWMSNPDITRESARFADLLYGNVARLAPGVGRSEAEAELNALAPSLGEAFDDISAGVLATAGFRARLVGLREETVGRVEAGLWMLAGAVGVVLLIAAANVANLFLVRAEHRRREIAVRRALGAGRIQLFAHLLGESAALCLVGLVLGLALARIGISFVLTAGPANLPRAGEVGIDTTVIGFAAVLSMCAAVAFALLSTTRHGGALPETLRGGGSPGVTGAPTSRGVGRALVALQAAMAVMLLICALLLVQSFARLRAIDPGFDAEGVLAIDFALPFRDYPDYRGAADFFRALQDRVAALPGVVAASGVGDLPLSPPQFPPTAVPLQAEGQVLAPDDLPAVGRWEPFLPGYFDALRIELVDGRWPEAATMEEADNPVVLNQMLARQLFGAESAVGKRLRAIGNAQEPGPWWTVVAVAGDVLYDGLTAAPPAMLYVPVLEAPVPPGYAPRAMTLVVRAAASPLALVPAVRGIVRDLDPNMPIANVRTVRSVVASATAQTSFTMVLLVTAASAAIFLGAVGVYGVASFTVGRRIAEIGLRMALGASDGDIRGMVLRQGVAVVIVGLAGGLLAAASVTHVAASLLYEVDPLDPVSFVAAPVVLLAVALLATAIPARRASGVDPVRALRGGAR